MHDHAVQQEEKDKGLGRVVCTCCDTAVLASRRGFWFVKGRWSELRVLDISGCVGRTSVPHHIVYVPIIQCPCSSHGICALVDIGP
jgi:hypothetical protein